MYWAHFVSVSAFAVIRLCVLVCVRLSDWALNELQKVETIRHLFTCVCACVHACVFVCFERITKSDVHL